MKHKNHVSGKAKKIRKELDKKFAIKESDIVKALKGNEKAAKHIAQMGIDGETLKRRAPQLAEMVTNSIDGTVAYNKMFTDIHKSAGKGALSIEDNIASIELAEIDLKDGRTQKALKFVTEKQLKEQSHKDSMQVIQMEAQIKDTELMSNHEYRVAKLENKLPLKQIGADRDYQEAKIDHVLEYGDSAQTKLIPRKQYTQRTIVQRVIDVISFFAGN